MPSVASCFVKRPPPFFRNKFVEKTKLEVVLVLPLGNLCIQFNVFDCLVKFNLSSSFHHIEIIGLFQSTATVGR